jgi:hypothetical protein
MIAQRTGRPHHAVVYVIRSLGIKPALKFGNINVYAPAAVGRIEADLERIRTRRAMDRETAHEAAAVD